MYHFLDHSHICALLRHLAPTGLIKLDAIKLCFTRWRDQCQPVVSSGTLSRWVSSFGYYIFVSIKHKTLMEDMCYMHPRMEDMCYIYAVQANAEANILWHEKL